MESGERKGTNGMTISQRLCQVFATMVAAVIILGTLIDCAGMAGKVASVMVGGG